MPSTSTCNKCKHGIAQEGDTWCLGCSSLDLAQEQLKNRWHSPAVRATAEEACLSNARLVKAFYNLDRGLAAAAAAQLKETKVNLTAAPQALPRQAPRSRSPLRSHRSSAAARPAPAVKQEPLPTGDSYEGHSESEEREEDRPVERRADKAPAASRAEPASSHRAETHHHRGEGRPHRPQKKTRRGGKRHQRVARALQDPFKRIHRPLKGDTVELAKSFASGLQRRA